MDIVAHALWSMAAGGACRERLRRPVRLRWMAAWGVVPDLIPFTVPAAIRVGRFLAGSSRSLLPDGSGPRFDWVWNIYNATHSALVCALCFAAAWLLLRRPAIEMFAWMLHIAIDVFTHSGLFAIGFLWPVSPLHMNGVRWETPWLLAMNYAALGSIYWLWWRQSARHEGGAV